MSRALALAIDVGARKRPRCARFVRQRERVRRRVARRAERRAIVERLTEAIVVRGLACARAADVARALAAVAHVSIAVREAPVARDAARSAAARTARIRRAVA